MEKLIEKLEKELTPLTSSVERDEFIEASEKAFDCRFDGTSTFYPWKMPTKIPKSFKIGVIVGSSGSGKSTILKQFGLEEEPIWENNNSIVSHFDNPDDAINKLEQLLKKPHANMGKISKYNDGTIDRICDILEGKGDSMLRMSTDYRKYTRESKY